MRRVSTAGARSVSASEVTLTQMMEVTDANVAGNVHGGVIMRLVDTAAALAAIKHSGGVALTVGIDEMTFLEPVHIGEVVVLKASVNDVGSTSMECGVRVEAQDPITGVVRHVNSAYLVFVAVDDGGRPRPVPPLLAETDAQRRRQREARLRRERRIAHKEAIDAARAAKRQGSAPPESRAWRRLPAEGFLPPRGRMAETLAQSKGSQHREDTTSRTAL